MKQLRPPVIWILFWIKGKFWTEMVNNSTKNQQQPSLLLKHWIKKTYTCVVGNPGFLERVCIVADLLSYLKYVYWRPYSDRLAKKSTKPKKCCCKPFTFMFIYRYVDYGTALASKLNTCGYPLYLVELSLAIPSIFMLYTNILRHS